MKKNATLRSLIFLCIIALVLTACVKKEAATIPPGGASSSTAGTPSTQPSPQVSPQASPKPGQAKSWSSAPEMKIDPKKSYQAEITTNKGKFKVELFAKDAPKTVNNFVFLSKEGFYNGIIFHRIIKPFMVQTGDPTGTGAGGPGYKFADELKSPYKYETGILAMANAGPNTNGSQFFICTGDDSKNLNQKPNYTIFGKVIEGMDTVLKIASTPVNASDGPTEKITIDSVTITES